ncbi:hypothetical protein D3C77_492370 [compost metagenome]
MDVQGSAQVRHEHAAQGTLLDAEVGRGLGPGDTKAQLAAIWRGNVSAHHVIDILLAAIHLEVGVLLPLRRGHDVIDGEHLVRRLVGKGCMGLRVGHVDDFALAFDISGDDHHTHVGLIGNPQNQGDVVGLECCTQVFQGTGHRLGIECAIVDVANQTVVASKVQAQLGQCIVSQHRIFHCRLLARVRPTGLPLLFLLFWQRGKPAVTRVQIARWRLPRQYAAQVYFQVTVNHVQPGSISTGIPLVAQVLRACWPPVGGHG